MNDDRLRQAILKAGTVRRASISFTQKNYSNNTVSPIETKAQEIVEIGIDDLLALIRQDRRELFDKALEAVGADNPLEPTPDAQDLDEAQRAKWREWSIVENKLKAEIRGKLQHLTGLEEADHE